LRERADSLARAFQGGDKTAFDELASLLADPLSRVGRRITGDPEEGRDVAQEALVKGYRAIAQWDGKGSFSGWMFSIATRCALDRLRRKRLTLETTAAPLMGAGPGPLQQSVTEERVQRIQAALASLTDRQRAMVVLRHYEGLSLAEIAEACGCSVGTVKSTLFQSFDKLRQKLIASGDTP